MQNNGNKDHPAIPGSGRDRLVTAVQELSHARTLQDVMDVVRRAARELTGADGASFVLRDGDQCYYAQENAIAPLWKGQRFPLSRCVSGWVMLNAKPATIEDIYADPRIPADAYRPTFVKSLAMVPIRRTKPIGAIGNYWATRHVAQPEEIALLQALADTTSVAMENVDLYTELQATIETLRQREARITRQRDALDVFTRSLAHDLKEPVRTIRAFAEMSAALTATDPARARYLTHIQQAGDRMAMLIDAVFLYTQLDDPDAVEKSDLALEDALNAAIANLAALIRQRGAVLTREPLPYARANHVHMVQLFQNLLSNAINHSPEPVHIHIGAAREANMTRIFVRDNGPGISPEYQKKIFEPFQRLTRNDAHSGLGLSISRKIAELHGGHLACRSAPGEGATFSFTLPAASEAARPDQGPLPAARPRGGADTLANVLLVDDRESDVHLTRTFLGEPLGMRCNFLVAHDGGRGLSLIEDAHAKGAGIHLVLLDINMPVMDGFEMLERLRANKATRGIPVVMCTGSTYEKDKARAKTLGAIGYLEKPARFEQLLPILENIGAIRLLRQEGGVLSLVPAEN